MNVQHISSAANPWIKSLKKAAHSNAAYKTSGLVWLEGEHLCDAFLRSAASAAHPDAITMQTAVLSQSVASRWQARLQECPDARPPSVLILPDALFGQISSLPSSGGLGFLLQLRETDLSATQTSILQGVSTVILDQVQDAGNVGSILRSAAAMGVQQVLALHGTAALWSSKVLRAGMGAHFALHCAEDLQPQDVALDVPIVVTSSHQGEYLHTLQRQQSIAHPCAWVFGHEGQGVGQAMQAKANLSVRIWQHSQESLNVAAAAAICLHATLSG